jgi:hypothetical protein
MTELLDDVISGQQTLLRMNKQELENLFRNSEPGPIPRGITDGTAIFLPGTIVAPVVRWVTKLLIWKGKVFAPDGTELLNRISPLGFLSIRAEVSLDASWLDAKPAILIDYSHSSFVAQKIRDEIREVAVGLYLGRVWWGKKHVLDFMLAA